VPLDPAYPALAGRGTCRSPLFSLDEERETRTDEMINPSLTDNNLKKQGLSKVFNDRRDEFRAFDLLGSLHLPGKIIGDDFLRNGLLQGLHDFLSHFRPT
jgi:hypothetical protein